MKKLLSTLLIVLAATFGARAAKPLEFHPDSTFRIMQLTDLHMKIQFPEDHEKTLNRIRTIAQKDRPDLIVITGDLVYSKPAAPMIKKLIAVLDALETPWLVVYGNHDAEMDLSRPDMSALYASGKYNINTLNTSGELADMEIPVMFGGKPGWYVYALDSHDYSPDQSAGRYGYFSFDQVNWMRECCSARRNADGTIAPGVAFFHIPLQEYVDAWSPMDDSRQGHGDSAHCLGMRGENIAHGALNTGMFAAMREGGSIVATFAGHDHDSDFVACYKGIALCYGRFSGGNGVYNNIPPGARLIELKAGTREMVTWMRDDQGRRLRHLKTDGKEIVKRYRDRPKGGLYGLWDD